MSWSVRDNKHYCPKCLEFAKKDKIQDAKSKAFDEGISSLLKILDEVKNGTL
jgi:hypothetical protein